MLLFVIVDSAVLACCKLKLGAVTQDTAKFVADLDNDQDVDRQTRLYIEGLLKASNQPVKNLKVKLKRFEINDAEAISVTVEGSYPLLENHLLPAQITLSETAAALVPSRKICGYVAISPDNCADPINHRKASLYFPVVRPSRRLPVWTLSL